MNHKTALITLSGLAESIACEPTQSAIEARDGILAAAKTVITISDAEQLQVAGDVLREVDAFINRVEAGRKTVKEPVITVGRLIDDTAKTLTLELGDEKKRLRDIIGKSKLSRNGSAPKPSVPPVSKRRRSAARPMPLWRRPRRRPAARRHSRRRPLSSNRTPSRTS